jgi:hypothetical protein
MQVFLDLAARLELLEGTGIVTVPVIHRGPATADQFGGLIGPSQFDSQFENPSIGSIGPWCPTCWRRTRRSGHDELG